MPSKHINNSTKQLLESITQHCYASKSHYKYSKNITKNREYTRGKIVSFEWINDLCYYYIKKDRELLNDFRDKLKCTKDKIFNSITTNSYKRAIYETICEIESKLES